MIQGIAFDLEGTTVNVEPAHHWGWIRAASEIGVNLGTPTDALEKVPNFSGGPDEEIIRQIYALAELQPSKAQASAFLERKWVHYEELIQTIDLRPRPGFFEAYGRFKCAGLPMTVGTAVELERGLALLKRSGLDRFFSLHEIVMISDVQRSKPAPDCFLETARRMKIDPKNQLIFEDSPRGVQAGIAAGSHVIAIPVYDTPIAHTRLREAGAKQIESEWGKVNVDALLLSFK